MRSLVFIALTFAVVVSAKFESPHKDFELAKLIVVNRHGHRAPNAPFWTLCPTEDANRKRFGVGDEDLTSVGFEEERRMGEALRKEYGWFIGNVFDRREHFIRAVGEPRTLESVNAICGPLFRSGEGPASQIKPFIHQPQYTPVFSDEQFNEYLMNDAPCWGVQRKYSAEWVASQGKQIAEEKYNKDLFAKVQKICHTPEEAAKKLSFDMFLKIVIDGIIFEHDFGLETLHNELSKSEFFGLRNLSHTFLIGKLLGNDVQKTIQAADFPYSLVSNLKYLQTGVLTENKPRDDEPMAWQTKFNLYDCHREELYGTMKFFGFAFKCEDMAPTEVPAGTSLIFEIYQKKDHKKCTSENPCETFVRPRLWTPRQGFMKQPFPGCHDPNWCKASELEKMYDDRIQRTGDWMKICHFTPQGSH